MRKGVKLRLDLSRNSRRLVLANGAEVSDDVARAVINHLNVEAAGDTLFPGRTPSQTFVLKYPDHR